MEFNRKRWKKLTSFYLFQHLQSFKSSQDSSSNLVSTVLVDSAVLYLPFHIFFNSHIIKPHFHWKSAIFIRPTKLQCRSHKAFGFWTIRYSFFDVDRYFLFVSYFCMTCVCRFRFHRIQIMRKLSIVLGVIMLVVGIQADGSTDCKDVQCPDGYRCSEGVCIKQQTTVKKTLCYLNSDLAPVKCTNRNYDCFGVGNAPSCGFSFDGIKTDFVNDCLPCLDKRISFFYRAPCLQAPSACLEGEECVNGKCMKLFQAPAYKDYVSCNYNSECRPIIELCIAGKCVKLTEAANAMQSANVRAPSP